MAVESFCYRLLRIIFSNGSPFSNRTSSALTLNEWSLSVCLSESIFKSFCSAFNMVHILAGYRFFPKFPCLLIRFRIQLSSLITPLHFSNKLSSSWLIASIFPVSNWPVFEKLEAHRKLMRYGQRAFNQLPKISKIKKNNKTKSKSLICDKYGYQLLKK